MSALVIGIASILLAIGTYLIWPSRWNVPAHLQLGFCVVSYVIPVWVVRVTRYYPPALVAIEAKILLIGAVAYIGGLLLGNTLPLTNVLRFPLSFEFLSTQRFQRFAYRRTTRILSAATLGLAGCFLLMGFVPMFAADRFDAKYFKGPYAALFHPYAIPYRICFNVVLALIPLALIVWYVTRRSWPLVLAVAGTALLGLALTRGPAAQGLLIFLGLVAAQRGRRWTAAFIALVALVYPLGAALYRVLGFHIYFHQNLWQVIAAGTPDVAQQLQFLAAFLGHAQFTHGRTFFAGLVSGGSPWNPANYTLRLLNEGTNLNYVASGGLRLTAPQWGFSAFGWLGALAVSFFSGLICGNAVQWVKVHMRGRDLLETSVILFLYMNFGQFLITFYSMNKGGLVRSAAVIAVAYVIILAREDREVLAYTREAPTWSLTRG